jgi:hypothetical protein
MREASGCATDIVSNNSCRMNIPKRDEQKFKVEIIRTVNKAVNSKNDEKQLSNDYLTDMSISYIHQSPTAEGVVGEFLC